MSKKPTVHELGADIVALLNSIGNLNSLPADVKRNTLVEVIIALKALIGTGSTGGGTTVTKLSQLQNDTNFTTISGARTATSQLNIEPRTSDPAFDSSQIGRIWYRSDLDV